MQEFTLEQIGMQVTALQNFFDQVTLIDPLAQAEVDPATLRATGQDRNVFTGEDLAGAIAFASPLSYPVVAEQLPPMLARALS